MVLVHLAHPTQSQASSPVTTWAALDSRFNTTEEDSYDVHMEPRSRINHIRATIFTHVKPSSDDRCEGASPPFSCPPASPWGNCKGEGAICYVVSANTFTTRHSLLLALEARGNVDKQIPPKFVSFVIPDK